MDILHACMYVYQMCDWCLQMSEKAIEFPETGITYGCEASCGSWEEHGIVPLQEHQMLLTSASPL